MYEAKSKKNEKKKVKRGIGKSNRQLSLSAKSNERSGRYIEDLDTSLPDKFNYKNKISSDDNDKQQDRKMRTIRKSQFSSEKDLPTKAGEFSFDTGWSEVGFDQKKKEAVVSFQSNYWNENARSVQEDNKAKRMRISKGEEVLTNDMETGVVSMRTKKSENSKHVRRQWEEASKKNKYKTTFDDVAPFHQIEEQKSKLEMLKDIARTDETVEKTDIQKAITGIQTYINKKNMLKLNFENKFDSEFNKAEKIFKWKNDDYVFIMKKKRMLEEENDIDKNKIYFNNLNKYMFNSKFSDAEKSKLKFEVLHDFNLKNDKNLVSEFITYASVKELMASKFTEEDIIYIPLNDFLNQNKSVDIAEFLKDIDAKHSFFKSIMGIECMKQNDK